MSMKKIGAATLGVVSLGALLLSSAVPANAFSNSRTSTLPGTNTVIQANAWSPNTICCGVADFVTSAKATVNGAAHKIATIKNTATVNPRGIGASVSVPGGVTVSGDSSRATLEWTNNNAWIADLSGKASYTGAVLTFHVLSSASAFDRGVKTYVDVWSW